MRDSKELIEDLELDRYSITLSKDASRLLQDEASKGYRNKSKQVEFYIFEYHKLKDENFKLKSILDSHGWEWEDKR